MANKRRFVYRDPQEDEYIFNCLVNYPPWARALLTPNEQEILKTHGSIRRFINNATGDQKKLVLAKANIRHISLYIDMNKEVPLDLKNFNKLYKSFAVAKDRQRVIDEIHNGNTFAISSRETLNGAYLIAQNCHTPYWFVNQNYRRVFNALENTGLKNLKNYTGNTDVQELKDMNDFRDICVNFFLSVLRSPNHVKVALKMSMMEIILLMHLFIHRDLFIEKRVLQHFLFDYKPNSVSVKLFQMVRSGYIDVNRGNSANTSYTIAELGIITVNELIQKVAQDAVVI